MKVLTNNQYYSQIADVIREQNGTSNTYTPLQMVRALKDLFYEEVEGVPPITFQGIGENLLDYKIDGAVGGVGDRTKNLFDYSTVTTGYRITWSTGMSVADNSAIMSDFIAVSNGIYRANVSVNLIGYDINKNYIGTYDPNNKIFRKDYGSKTTYYDIADNNVKFVKLLSFSTTDTLSQNTMFCNSTTILEYEPYGYKVPVVISGKNLFDEENAVNTDYYITSTGQETVGANGDKFLKSHIYVNPSTQYTFKWSQTIMGSANNTPYIRISEYTSNNTFIQRLLCQCSAQSQNNYTFTTSNNTLYIDIIIDSETSTRGQHLTEIMLVKGATAPDTYEEYTATTTNIYLDEPIEGKANIPSEYTEVEYIESTGTQYINTGFKLNTNCRIVFDYYLSALVSFSPFGSFQNQNSIGFTAYTTGNNSRFGTFATNNLTGNYNQYQINNRAHFEYSKNGLYQNGSLVYSITTNDAVSNYNCFIFARNANDVATGLGNIRLYYFKIYDNDSLVRNLIPCYRKSDNKPGMYDTITETFFTNSGTGNFIVGSIKENESITLSDTNVDIPTIRGTNVLTVDTTVQPSNVYVKSRHESSYETIMRERYEEAQAQLDALN